MDQEPNLTGQPPEVIRQHIQETRSALTSKLETLEHEVKETVQSARSAVADTVETVKQTVENTVNTVRGTVQGTVESVKNTFDLRQQVERHPWAAVGGSVAVGFVLGRLVPFEDRVSRGMSRSGEAPGGVFREPPRPPEPVHEFRAAAGPAAAASSAPGFLEEMTQKFQPEINKLKGLAIGAVFALVRDMVKQSVPEPLAPQLEQLVDNVAVKLGGEPVRGPLLDTNGHPARA